MYALPNVNTLFAFLCLMLVSTSFGQISQTIPGNYTFIVPAGVTSITVETWGAGAGGESRNGGGGNGGDGGGYGKSTLSVTTGASYTYTVGTGGSAGANGTSSLLRNSSGVILVQGAGGSTGVSNIGTNTFIGGAGGVNGDNNNKGGAGGGSAAGSTASGNNGIDVTVNSATNGGAAVSGGGGGGAGGNDGSDGANGGNPGGGGGGSGKNKAGGKGGNGLVNISFICPTSAGTLSGNQYLCRYAPNNTTTFTSTVAGGTWSTSDASIATVNQTTGAVTAISAGTTTITYTIDSSGCTTRTATRTVYVANEPGAGPLSINGSQTQCANSTTTYTITPDVYSFNYVWSYDGTGATIAVAPDGLSATVTFGADATRGNMVVQSENACGMDGGGTFLFVSIVPIPSAPETSSANSPSCNSFVARWGFSRDATSYAIDVATDNSFTNILPAYNNYNVGDNRTLALTGLTPGTTYYYRVRGVNSCGTGSNSATMSYTTSQTTTPTIGAITHPTCSNANGSLLITNYSTANTYTITPSTGVTNNAGSITAPQGAYTVTARNISTGCVSPALSFTINAQPGTAATPSLGTTTQPSCVLPTGSVVLNNLPSSGTWTITQTGTVGASYTGTGTNRTISGLAAGTYNFTVSTPSTCVSGSSSTLTITGLETKTWNGSAWSGPTTGTAVPTLDKHIVFTGNYTAANDIEGCSCLVNSGANVTIQTNRYMKIVNQVVVNTSGSLTFENNASLIQITDTPTIPNSGNITYKRTTTPILKTDYVYWSSPVSGFTLGGIQTGTLYYSYNEPANSWAGAGTSTVMTSGIGYIVRGEGTGFDRGTLTINAAFIGPPNNGVVSASSTGAGKTSLLGNPYPSALDADAFLLANNAVLEGTLYFWTHNTAIQLANAMNTTFGSGKYAYTSDDYATYNFTGGTGTGGQSVSGASQIPDGKIASGVGFFADGAGSGGPVIFNNSMRLNNNAVLSNSQFFKPASGSKTTKTNSVEKNRIWLNLTNNEGAFKQTLLGYITGATNKYDRGYDGVSYDGNSYLDFYSINEDTPLTIQGRALPFAQSDVIPLGYSSKISGNFTISIEKTDGFLESQDVFLEDKMTGYYTNLKKSSYTFSTSEGTFNDRFTINYISKATPGTDDFVSQENGVVIFNKNKEITIQSSEELIAKVQVFDVSGKLIIEKSKLNSNETILRNLSLADQVLIVKVVLENGKTISEKIIY